MLRLLAHHGNARIKCEIKITWQNPIFNVEAIPRQLKYYVDAKGSVPCEEWLHDLKDQKARGVIRARLKRIERGLLGDCRFLGDGVHEMRIDFGPGYRVYFGEDGPALIVLLAGGVKRTQVDDIREAKKYWRDYNA